MAENKNRDPIPENFETLEEFWEFWDEHSLADYEDKLQDIEVEVNLQDEGTEIIALDKGAPSKLANTYNELKIKPEGTVLVLRWKETAECR
ncbi:hypothetical protein H8E77_20905 [bacterium]|nr:hypothetical protein [bacterium]